ncbi:MAG: 4-hydroxythreonine-4-phosphate dehydrogenase PdxA [Pseudomonadota bacterium]
MTLAITCGEPAGIGPELCVRLAGMALPAPVVAIGDAALFVERASQIGCPVSVTPFDDALMAHTPGTLPVIDLPFPARDCVGAPDTRNAATLIEGLDLAVDGCRSGRFAGMVTAPLHKQVINDAGIAFSGHTEYLAERCGNALPVMLLAGETLRVALATTHLPLRDVAEYITTERLTAVLDVLWQGLRTQFGIDAPHIAVCGLNPHAGEGGHLGHEDAAAIAPAVAAQQAQGRNVTGPHPADTVFNHAGRNADAVLAMFHDQGLPVVKYADFSNIVNVTLGLPIVRTSVDHGTALDIAGTGQADPASLLAAIRLAATLTDGRS